MEKFKFTKEEAQKIYDRFHELYKESDRWVNSKIEEASHQGYITGAFGLRVRTPKLHASILGSKATPVEVAAEARTAANFLGQSYCMLLSRAASEVNKQVRASDKADMIVPVAQIHDAMYYLVKRDPSVLDFLHRIMLKAISWQEDPVIYHDKVKLTGNLSLFDPSWAIEHEIPNDFTYDNFVEYLKNE